MVKKADTMSRMKEVDRATELRKSIQQRIGQIYLCYIDLLEILGGKQSMTNLYSAEYSTLWYLRKYPDGINLTEIARLTSNSYSYLSRKLGQMQRDGLITKSPAKGRLFVITKKGLELLSEKERCQRKALEMILGKISNNELKALEDAVELFEEACDQTVGETIRTTMFGYPKDLVTELKENYTELKENENIKI